MLHNADVLESTIPEKTNSGFKLVHLKHYMPLLSLLLVFALFLECFLWNSYYWNFDSDTYQQKEVILPHQEQLQRNALVIGDKEPTLSFSNVNQMVRSIRIEGYGGSYLVKGTVLATSQNHAFSPQKISTFAFATGLNSDLSKPTEDYQKALVKFDLLEPVINLYLSFDAQTIPSPLVITKITLNPEPEFNFSLVRVVLMLIGLFLLYVVLFSKLYQHKMAVDGSLYKWINRGILILMLLFSVGILTAHHPKFATDTGFKLISLGFLPYNTPNHTLLQEIPKTQEELGNVDPYIELTDALFVKHQLNLDLWVDPKLFELNNIYDPTERAAKDVKFYLDRAFNNGKYYCYFGLAPIFLIYGPIYLLTGLVPGAAFAVFIATIYAIFGLHALSSRLISLLCDECNTTLFVVSKITLYMASLTFFLQSQMVFYRLPYLTAIAALCFAMYYGLGLLFRPRIKGKNQIADNHLSPEQIIQDIESEHAEHNQVQATEKTAPIATVHVPEARKEDGSWSADLVNHENSWLKRINKVVSFFQNTWHSPTTETLPFVWDFKQMTAMIACGFCVVLVVMSRPLTLLYLIVGLGVIYLLYLVKVQQSIKAKIINSLCLIVPIVLGAILVCAYNHARFGTIFEFGQLRQITGDDVGHNYLRFNLEYLKTFFFNVLFSNMEFTSAFPFVDLNSHEELHLGQHVYLADRSGLFMIPYYWGLFMLPILWTVKRLSCQGIQNILPPLQRSLALRGIQLIISLWYLVFPCLLVLIACNAGWNYRYLADITAIACILPFLFVMLLDFKWQSYAEKVMYVAWIGCCVVSFMLMFFLLINNTLVELDFINPRLFLELKEIFDPLGFS